jgi:hypothetical protein
MQPTLFKKIYIYFFILYYPSEVTTIAAKIGKLCHVGGFDE